MAKINRIVTSGIEGRNLSDKYNDNSYVYNSDGRIDYHGNSKMVPVIAPGIVYGANEDSGDGYGLNTIKLVPNSQYGDINDDRYLIIDPTSPNHIHIRAGGSQDNSNAELILGAELTNVKVSDAAGAVTITTPTGGEAVNQWRFENDGNITAYQDTTLQVASVPGILGLSAYNGVDIMYSDAPGSGVYLNNRDNPENRVASMGDVHDLYRQATSWTPELSGVGFTQSSNPATGSYYKVGHMVFANMYIPFTNVTNFGTGQYSVTLPFTAARQTDIFGGSIHNTGSPTTFYSIKGHLEPGSNIMTLWYIASTALDQPITHSAPITLNVTDLIHMSFMYEANGS